MNLEKKQIGWFARALFFLAIAGTIAVTIVSACVFWFFSRGLPNLISVEDYRPAGVTRIISESVKDSTKDENILGEYYTQRRYVIPYEKMPDILVKAFISAEDDRFFEHQGVNLTSMLRASVANFRAGHVVQGGSTITQQVAKSFFLTSERTMDRKLKEIILASRIEKNLTKQQILYLYLNQIYLGHHAYGVQAAAKAYFKKDVSELTVAECALLAGMPQAPGKYSPLLTPQKSKERQRYVLRRMYENSYITVQQMNDAASEPIKVYDDDETTNRGAAYLVEQIRRYLIEKYGEKAVYEDALTVSVPATMELSQSARKAMQDGLRAVDKRIGFRGPIEKVNKPDKMEAFLKKERIELIKRRVGYQLFLPEGRMDWIEAMNHAGLKTESDLLEPDQLYKALVTGVDDKKKMASVMLGAIRAELPMEKMRWARPLRDDKTGIQGREPETPSRVVSKGDVVWVQLVSKTDGRVIVALDQEPEVQGALFSMEAQTGNVISMVGGYEYTPTSQFNRAIQAQRQPGSAFKPIIYAAALEKGFTPATVIVDSPIIYGDDTTGKWKPDNFEDKFYGDTTFRQALIKSRNVPTIKIVQAIQIPALVEFANRIGLNGQYNMDLSISLGSSTTSLMNLTRTFALFPRLGRKVTPIFISSVKDRDGKVLEEQKAQPAPVPTALPGVPKEQIEAQKANAKPGEPEPQVFFPKYPLPEDPDVILDPRTSYVMTHLMKEVVAYGTGYGAKNLNRPAAGKTGTTNDNLDAWFMGFTPTVITGVWVGFDNQKSLGPSETGAKAALPIWLSYMREAVKKYPDSDFMIPPGIVFATIDSRNGKLASPNSSNAIKEAFIEGTEPTETSAKAAPSTDTQSDFLKEDTE
ncbi:PBP1A family penicillin-binding protein [bacterium]|jgi:penicillin-binding protein 1A|nr:PBP1A family penicillin-binding protein [bacterium]